MNRIFSHIESKAEQINHHAFMKLMNELTPESSYKLFKEITIAFVHLTMTFRDLNRLYYCYSEPKDIYQEYVNAHAEEDTKHWQFLLMDMEALSVDKTLPLTQAIPELWHDENLYLRKYIYSVLARAKSCSTCAIRRLTAMESGEAGVRVFFTGIKRSAAMVKALKGINLTYFGEHHIDTEMATKVNIDPFKEVTLADEDLAFCLNLVDEHFASFTEFLDSKYAALKNDFISWQANE